MSHAGVFDSVFALEQALGATWPHIRGAHDTTAKLHGGLTKAVASLSGEDVSIVVLGSAGRFEATSGSDTDWTYLVDGQAKPEHQINARQAAEQIRKVEVKGPGREGVFGVMAFSHDLIQYVGGEDDTNANLTRRILLLLESKPIGRPDAYIRVVRAILDQYLSNDHGFQHGSTHGVPRFLLNDISRYWRTVAVDYAYKRRTRNDEGWALRSAKLRLSRKLTFAAGLLYCFSLAKGIWRDAAPPSEASRQRAIEHLWTLTSSTPLNLLADAFLRSEALNDVSRKAFTAYDRFLQILDTRADRERLSTLKRNQADKDDVYQLVRTLGDEFQQGLTALFLESDSTRYASLIKQYGVF